MNHGRFVDHGQPLCVSCPSCYHSEHNISSLTPTTEVDNERKLSSKPKQYAPFKGTNRSQHTPYSGILRNKFEPNSIYHQRMNLFHRPNAVLIN